MVRTNLSYAALVKHVASLIAQHINRALCTSVLHSSPVLRAASRQTIPY